MEKRSGCYSHICFSTHFLLAFMVKLSLCRNLSPGLSKRYLGSFFRSEGNKCLFFDFLCFLESRVPLASPACFMRIFCLWCGELGCDVQSDPVSKAEAQGNRIGFLIISVDNCIEVPLPSFPLMHLFCPAWSDPIFSTGMMLLCLYQFPNEASTLLGPLNINKTNAQC